MNDFIDYLVYIEHNAENLQFFLWYRDYVRRFEALPENEKVLSPEWMPESSEVPDLSKGIEKENKKARREAVAPMMETGYDSKGLRSLAKTKILLRVRAGICLLVRRMEALLYPP